MARPRPRAEARRRRRQSRVLRWLMILLVPLLAGPVVYIEGTCRAPLVLAELTPSAAPATIAEPGYRRDEAASFVAFPESYIVFAEQDYARFLQVDDESTFPYMSTIWGYWRQFCTLNRLMRTRGESWLSAKVKTYATGVRYTVEQLTEAAYEKTVGRLAEWRRGVALAPADRFARSVAEDYARFLVSTPWYDYPYLAKIGALWALPDEPDSGGPRDWERTIALTLGYAGKAALGGIAALKKSVVADTPDADILLVIQAPPEGLANAEPGMTLPGMTLEGRLDDGRLLVRLPRGRDFTTLVTKLARAGARFAEIAGNDEILLTALRKIGQEAPLAGAQTLFTMRVWSRPGFHLVGLRVETARLAGVIRTLEDAGDRVARLYDY